MGDVPCGVPLQPPKDGVPVPSNRQAQNPTVDRPRGAPHPRISASASLGEGGHLVAPAEPGVRKAVQAEHRAAGCGRKEIDVIDAFPRAARGSGVVPVFRGPACLVGLKGKSKDNGTTISGVPEKRRHGFLTRISKINLRRGAQIMATTSRASKEPPRQKKRTKGSTPFGGPCLLPPRVPTNPLHFEQRGAFRARKRKAEEVGSVSFRWVSGNPEEANPGDSISPVFCRLPSNWWFGLVIWLRRRASHVSSARIDPFKPRTTNPPIQGYVSIGNQVNLPSKKKEHRIGCPGLDLKASGALQLGSSLE